MVTAENKNNIFLFYVWKYAKAFCKACSTFRKQNYLKYLEVSGIILNFAVNFSMKPKTKA